MKFERIADVSIFFSGLSQVCITKSLKHQRAAYHSNVAFKVFAHLSDKLLPELDACRNDSGAMKYRKLHKQAVFNLPYYQNIRVTKNVPKFMNLFCFNLKKSKYY